MKPRTSRQRAGDRVYWLCAATAAAMALAGIGYAIDCGQWPCQELVLGVVSPAYHTQDQLLARPLATIYGVADPGEGHCRCGGRAQPIDPISSSLTGCPRLHSAML